MRERSHEIGRRQLLGVVTLLTRQASERVEVVKIGTAYETGMRTRYAARHQLRNEVVYDAVLGFRYRDARPEITCLIESKTANTRASRARLAGHLADFVVRAYCVQSAWTDKLHRHRPLFLFVAGAAFPSKLMEYGKLDEGKVRAELAKRLPAGTVIIAGVVEQVCAHTRVLVYDDWLDQLIG